MAKNRTGRGGVAKSFWVLGNLIEKTVKLERYKGLCH